VIFYETDSTLDAFRMFKQGVKIYLSGSSGVCLIGVNATNGVDRLLNDRLRLPPGRDRPAAAGSDIAL
jgi:hypothetical protein